MIDVRNPQAVVVELGQSALDAIGVAVDLSRQDFALYRSTLPRFAARHTQRGILNWIHDQLFAHLHAEFEAHVPGTTVLDEEPVRDIFVGDRFRLRFKKHSDDELISSYPTQGFLGFVEQDPPQLLQQVRLVGGYRWDAETRTIGSALLSARDGLENVLWVLELAAPAAGVAHFTPQPIDPTLPALPELVAPVEIDEGTGEE